ncbi:hypothetical protein ACFOD0_15450 [Shewanella intestini]|uniref:Diguanylate cyclase n=1 Tax=Shewanella intestini TaxID=2017544 RepID=A0ABS5I530_9GAMM|nr:MULTISPECIES: hypothetical protein [Shewanella]MBR9729116.1 hypothetical protein [Shewanella intestini]MRG37192.1 hypothetical protein [Shewanella sp. XMDDZSB0408]
MLLAFSLSIHFSVAGPSKRVFDERDGLSGGAIFDINFDDYGFVWLATEQGLYRASSSMVRRIDKVGFESMLEHEKLHTVKSVDANTLYVGAFSGNYLYDIHQNQFTKLSLEDIETSPLTHIIKAKPGLFGQFYALSKNGHVFQMNKAKQQLDFEFSLTATTDTHWRDFAELDDSSMIFIGKRSVIWVAPHRRQININWPSEYGEINEILVANNQVWLMASKGLFTVDLDEKKITTIDNMPYFLKAGVIDQEGMFWLGGYDGLIKWDPIKNLQINYKQQLKMPPTLTTCLTLPWIKMV